MSGRLIITTKKSYCPWNAANVERVRRDERLERERLVRQQSEENQSHNRPDKREPQGHINLFPEAREAEIRLTHTNDVQKNDSNGILNVPLGGDESNNRKNGKVPFYMQAQSQQEEKYDKSSYLGIRGSRSGAAPADKITDTLMRDQFTSREEYRKQKNDPMSRFYDDSTDAARNIYADRESSSRADQDLQSNCHPTSLQETDYSLEPQPREHGQTKSRKRKSNPSEGADDNDDGSEASSSSLSSRGRKHDHKKNQKSKHSSSSHGHNRRKKSPLHNKKKRHKDKKTKRKHRSKDRGEDEGDRQERHHHPSSPQSNIDHLMKRKMSDTHQLEDMRRRRHAREAREMERQRRLM